MIPNLFLAVEGSISAGKSTLTRDLAHAIRGRALLEDTDRHPFIRDFYLNPDRFALETELTFLLLHYHQLLTADDPVIVTDFQLDRDRVFSRLTLQAAEDLDLFDHSYSLLRHRLPTPDILIYLKAPVSMLRRRISGRGRNYEQVISNHYLERVAAAFDEYFEHRYEGRSLSFDARTLDTSINRSYVETVIDRLPL